MICEKCGKNNDDLAEICIGCGFKIKPEAIVENVENKDINTTGKTQIRGKTHGNIKKLIDAIIERKGKGNTLLIIELKKKLVFKGINPNKYTHETIDDPVVMEKLLELARDLGFKI
jgi:hypothetical protein